MSREFVFTISNRVDLLYIPMIIPYTQSNISPCTNRPLWANNVHHKKALHINLLITTIHTVLISTRPFCHLHSSFYEDNWRWFRETGIRSSDVTGRNLAEEDVRSIAYNRVKKLFLLFYSFAAKCSPHLLVQYRHTKRTDIRLKVPPGRVFELCLWWSECSQL